MHVTIRPVGRKHQLTLAVLFEDKFALVVVIVILSPSTILSSLTFILRHVSKNRELLKIIFGRTTKNNLVTRKGRKVCARLGLVFKLRIARTVLLAKILVGPRCFAGQI